MLLRNLRLLQFLAVNGDFDLFSFLLQRFQPLFCGGRENALLDGVEHILYAGFDLFQTSIELRLDVASRKRLVESFVNAVFIYDDKVVFTFNYKDGSKTATIDEINAELGSDLEGTSPPYHTKGQPTF